MRFSIEKYGFFKNFWKNEKIWENFWISNSNLNLTWISINTLGPLQLIKRTSNLKFWKNSNFKKFQRFKFDTRSKSKVSHLIWVIGYWPHIKCWLCRCMLLGICWRVICYQVMHHVMRKYNLKYLSAIQSSFFSPFNPTAIKIRALAEVHESEV